MSENWKKIRNTLTEPAGWHWENNGKSRFGGAYRHRLVKDDGTEVINFPQEEGHHAKGND